MGRIKEFSITEPIEVEKEFIIGSVYLLENKINKKIYIGKTIDNYNCRFSKHKRCAKNGTITYFYNALRKYGWDSFNQYIIFQTEILKISNKNRLRLDKIICNKEVEFIDLFKSFNSKFGYNLTKGGDGVSGYKFSEESKAKMSRDRSGKNHSNYGKTDRAGKCVKQFTISGEFVKEHQSMSSAARELKVAPNNISRACKEKRSTKGFIWILSSEFSEEKLKEILEKTNENIAKIPGFNGNNKEIRQYDLKGAFIKNFISASEASRELKCNSSLVSGAANGKYKKAKKFIWIYEKEFTEKLLNNKIKAVKNE